MRMKKALAALLALLMVLSLFSGLVIAADAAGELGGPVTVEEITAQAGGIVVPGKELPANIFVMNPKWQKDGDIVSVKLGGVAYRAMVGVNAFSTFAGVLAVTKSGATIYLCAGSYSGACTANTSNLKIYGPYGGVCPNDPADISQANPERPGTDEAIITSGTFYVNKDSANICFDGVTLGGCIFSLNAGGQYRAGTYIQNCIVSTSGNLVDFNRGFNVNFNFVKNRVLNAAKIFYAGGIGDVTITDNYLNTTGYLIHPTSYYYAGSIGNYMRIERNYCNKIGGFYYTTSVYEVPQYYSLQIYDNIVNCGTSALIDALIVDYLTVAGTNFQIRGNTFRNMAQGFTYFRFPRSKRAEVTPRFNINVNENRFDLPVGSPLLSCEANAVIDCSRNYYNGNGITPAQFSLASEDALILYPYYKDEALTELAGDARVVSVDRENGVLDNENRTIDFDIRGEAVDTYDLTGAFTVSEDCTWKLYEDRSLETELEDNTVWLNGSLTHCFLAVSTPDGAMSNLYEIRLTGDVGAEAELLSVELDNASIPAPEIGDHVYTFTLASNYAFLNYRLRVSSGAKYELFSDEAFTTPLEDMDGYVPYGGYTVYAKITSEDGETQNEYRIVFNRERSEVYDPSIISGVLPNGGFVIRQSRRIVAYVCEDLLLEETFDFKVTKGARYGIFSDPECTAESYLSSTGNLKPIKLKEDANTFYIQVLDDVNSTVYTFSVLNGSKSSDTSIQEVAGFSSTVVRNTITITASSDKTSVEFNTRNPYTVVMLYADAEHTIPMEYKAKITQVEGTGHVIEKRTFSVNSSMARTVYYAISTAEDGTTRDYELILNRNIYIPTFVDLGENAWYVNYVNQVAQAGVMSGSTVNEKDYFRPTENTTRQEMAIVVTNLMGLDAESFSGVKLPYADESKIAGWALNAVKACYKTGLISGAQVGDKVYYNPTNNISRQETMAILVRAFDLHGEADLSRFKDADKIAAWARESVAAAVEAGIVSGSDQGYLNPTANITRAELATIIANI